MLPDLHDPTYTRSVEELNPEIESGMAGARGWGRRMGSKGLKGTCRMVLGVDHCEK